MLCCENMQARFIIPPIPSIPIIPVGLVTQIFKPRLEASRPRLVGWSVCWLVGLQNKICYEVAFKTKGAFKTSFALKLPSNQDLLSMRGY